MKNAVSVVEVLKLNLEQIIPNPDQPRNYFDPEKLALLADTIKDRGDVADPIKVMPQDGGVFMIVDGERRWRAAKMAGIPTISCLVNQALSEDEMFELSSLLNFCKEDMTYFEIAKALRRIMDQRGINQVQLSRLLGVHPSEIRNYLKVLNLISEIQQALKERKIGVAVALNIANFKTEHQANILTAFYEMVKKRGGDSFSASEVSRAIKQITEKKIRPQRHLSSLPSINSSGSAFERTMDAFCAELSRLCNLSRGDLHKLKSPSARLILQFIEQLQERLLIAEKEIQKKLD